MLNAYVGQDLRCESGGNSQSTLDTVTRAQGMSTRLLCCWLYDHRRRDCTTRKNQAKRVSSSHPSVALNASIFHARSRFGTNRNRTTSIAEDSHLARGVAIPCDAAEAQFNPLHFIALPSTTCSIDSTAASKYCSAQYADSHQRRRWLRQTSVLSIPWGQESAAGTPLI